MTLYLKNFYQLWTKRLKKTPNFLFCFFISVYKAFLSGNLMMGGSCRFYPSCSDYAFFVYKNYSFLKACRFFLKRIFNCHPLGPKWREEPEIKNFV